MKKTIVKTDKAPAAIGPYSQAVKVGNLLYTSGQIPINPATGKIDTNDFEGQLKQVLENILGIFDELNSDKEDIVKFTVFLKDLNDFKKLNEIFTEYFPENPPARSAVQVSRLPLDVLVEIEAIGVVGD